MKDIFERHISVFELNFIQINKITLLCTTKAIESKILQKCHSNLEIVL